MALTFDLNRLTSRSPVAVSYTVVQQIRLYYFVYLTNLNYKLIQANSLPRGKLFSKNAVSSFSTLTRVVNINVVRIDLYDFGK